MDTENNIVLPLGPRVVEVEALSDYRLLLTWDNGEIRLFDAKPLLEYPVFQPLKNKGFFGLVKVDEQFGSIIWPRDIDYCPDTLYQQSIPFK